MYLDAISTISTQYLYSIYTLSTHIYALSTQDCQEPEQEEGGVDAASSVCDGSVTGDVVTRDSRDMARSVTATPTNRQYFVA